MSYPLSHEKHRWGLTLVLFPAQTHSGSVWRVTWAHPEFGQVLASCSFDRTAAVWEEIVGESNDKQRGLSHWVSATVITCLTLTLTLRMSIHRHYRHGFYKPQRPLKFRSLFRTLSPNHISLFQIKRTTLVDSRTSVTDVKFAPKHMGLMLTTCSADGVVRIYEAPDVMNLSQWSLQHEISCKLSCSCISWNPSR